MDAEVHPGARVGAPLAAIWQAVRVHGRFLSASQPSSVSPPLRHTRSAYCRAGGGRTFQPPPTCVDGLPADTPVFQTLFNEVSEGRVKISYNARARPR